MAMLSMFGIFGVSYAQGQTGLKGSVRQTQGGTLQPVTPTTVETKKGVPSVVEQVNVGKHMIGGIDWENKVVYAVGDGVQPPDAISPAQAAVRAKRAAIDDAYANLLEAIQEVRVDAESTSRDFVNVNRAVRDKVEGFVQNPEIVDLQQSEDGRFQIKMKMPMLGQDGLSTALYPVQRSNVVQVRVVYRISQSTPEAPREAPQTPEALQRESSKSFTGLIINAKGLHAKPALYPRILTAGGQTVYDIDMPNPNATVGEGLVEYRKSLEDAKKLARVGANPLVIKATQLGGKYGADIVLSEEDARKILEADERTKFLGDAKVAVVID
jgi:hypothetical protein